MSRPLDTLAASGSRRFLSSTGIATGLVAPLALGAPGNLDAGFGDHGRVLLQLDYGSEAWSVDALDDGNVFVAGGLASAMCAWYNYYDCEFVGSGFAGELTGDGEIDARFTPTRLEEIEVRDAVRQPDGKVIMTGRRLNTLTLEFETLVAYRLDASGALDTSFGEEGIFELPSETPGTARMATSALLDPDGHIVIAGSSGDSLIVLRLLPDGTLDPSFGNGGIAVGPRQDFTSRTFVERTVGGGYRVASNSESRCQIVGLTAAGALDHAFGTGGIAAVKPLPDVAAACSAMAAQADGALLLAGSTDGQGFATRLLATGAADPAFAANSVAATMSEGTAIAVDLGGKVLVAGVGGSGTLVTRLESDGSVDGTFGEGGSTFVDLPATYGSHPRVHALDVGADGRVLAAGSETPVTAFVIQLHGDGGGTSPGVLSLVGSSVEVAEGTELVVRVRRSGGATGSVSIDYRSLGSEAWVPSATDADFALAPGTLTWGDGETGEREITVPILSDSSGPEESEAFDIELEAPTGGAGLGTRRKQVIIKPDGAPGGQLSFGLPSESYRESQTAQVWVYRDYYSEGQVSVTLTPFSESAIVGEDFVASPVTLTWADQDTEPKMIEIPIVDDSDKEGLEHFTLNLTNPTGGAILGRYSSANITISSSDSPPDKGGGGTTGWLSLLLLGLAELFRRATAHRLSGGR